ncbi:NADH-dependent [FeFe] hydrogenase, group A6 [Sphaerochaeta globosa]|uniref:Hydrogenase, Fe-only n=1 Tax=Sphaerochaeta globosa (strain ATCC BAA-1886 / DSM 22777 / Buddy) TaxID=158189 RepID=F0RW60_SPHGB|nr:NADH-dependent [FeFe] hydrogenase, group A6 [Sphaerochaeta globosa]ADY13417.1 hydrogenase, Fe-only [Sphaerochaeta globosa str. Buddy]
MDEQLITCIIDGNAITTQKGTRILDACMTAGIKIPTLCYLKDVSAHGSCGMCMVEVEGAKRLVRSCMHTVTAGMVIHTHTQRVLHARKLNLELILANHPLVCTTCERNLNCELQSLSQQLGVRTSRFPRTKKKFEELDVTSASLVRDPNACILCNRCVEVCSSMQSVSAIQLVGRGLKTKVATFYDQGLGNSVCTNCGQCSLVCPTAAITEKSQQQQVFDALSDPDLVVLVQTAPAIRVGLGEAMGLKEGSLVTGRMVSALRSLGFDKVFDTQFTADLTIMEEAYELIHRLTHQGELPMITSCSPGWIKFIETFYPEQVGHLSSCKSPQQMFGAIAKTFYAEQANLDPRKIRVVSIMPCTAKKFEAGRSEMDSSFDYWKEKMNLGEDERFCDVDWALTTRELAKMLKQVGIDFSALKEEAFDDPLGASTGGAVIFASSGGVMEAALRTAVEKLTGSVLAEVEFAQLRERTGIREAALQVGDSTIKVAVANTLSNARVLLDQIQGGTSPYAFIEVMTCPDGCLGGGGQPIPTNADIRLKRAQSIYEEDRHKPIRKSHENPAIQDLYARFLDQPLSEMSHHLLHTTYTKRQEYPLG